MKPKSFKTSETITTKKINIEMNRRLFLKTIENLGIDKPIEDYNIKIPYKIEYAWVDIRLAIEITDSPFIYNNNDLKKDNWLDLNGWTLLRYCWQNINYDEIKLFYFTSKKTLEKLNKLHI